MKHALMLSAGLSLLSFTGISQSKQKADTTTKKEKTTIVIDGDKVTINGKVIDGTMNEDFQIIRGDGGKRVIMLADSLRMKLPARGRVAEMPLFWQESTSNKAFLGVASEKTDSGLEVTEVSKNSPAEKAGIQVKDIIVSVDGRVVVNSQDLYETIGKYNPNDLVKIEIQRNGKKQTVEARLARAVTQGFRFELNDMDFDMPLMREFGLPGRPGERVEVIRELRKPRIGLQIQETEEGNGVAVLEVTPESPAAKAGLQKGDLITSLQKKPITDLDAALSILRELKEGESATVVYKRNGKEQKTDIKLPKQLKKASL